MEWKFEYQTVLNHSQFRDLTAIKRTSEGFYKDLYYVWFEDGYHLSFLEDINRKTGIFYFFRHDALRFTKPFGHVMKCVATIEEFKTFLQ